MLSPVRSIALLAVALAAPLGCRSPEPGGPGPVAPPATSDAAPGLRLDDRAEPLAYRVRLAIDPASETFSGAVEIDVRVAKPSRVLWLHGVGLEVAAAKLRTAGGDRPASTETAEPGLLGFRFEEPVPAGEATLSIWYRGAIARVEGRGVFAEKSGDEWYQFTQFEALDARRAFPCFDEPRWKVPWTLSIEVAEEHTAVSNTPVASEEPAGPGKKLVRFEETRPLPTYLVAFGVGPFDFREAAPSRSGVPIRIVTPRGRATDAAYAAEVTPPILALLEDYFATSYPYRKLDVLTIPSTQGFGAMEHPGLVTFSARLALWRPEQESFRRRQLFALIQAHELGHQWFGNLVTMPWWDDIWLNEAFASWIENRVLHAWQPGWRLAAKSVENSERAMAADSLGTARRIREPIADEGGIDAAFDRITYEKGESVIRMFEAWVGLETWRAGIRAYLDRHAWKTATAGDFLAAMSEVAGKDVATPFNTFLDQNGLPLVAAELRCAEGKAPVAALRQSRYRPLGSRAEPERRWQIPVCVKHPGGTACTLLAAERGEVALGEAGAACPAWIYPNAGGVGYYRTQLDEGVLDAVLRGGAKALTAAERLALIGDLRALAAAGAVPADRLLARAGELARDRDPLIALAAVDVAHQLETLVDPRWRPRWRATVRRQFSSALARLGRKSRSGEGAQVAALRAKLIELLGIVAADRATGATAVSAARRWLRGGAPLDANLSAAILKVAAYHGDEALLAAMTERARAANNNIERRQLLRALGHFRDPELRAAAFALVLDPGLDAREGVEVIAEAATLAESRSAALEFTAANFDTLAPRLSESRRVWIAESFHHGCSLAERDRVLELFTPRIASIPGGKLALAQTREHIELCAAFRASQQPRLAAAVAPGSVD
jgi:alanyl aminopeptidase